MLIVSGFSQAVKCPFNLGSESQCGRIIDQTSCYCATFTKVYESIKFVSHFFMLLSFVKCV